MEPADRTTDLSLADFRAATAAQWRRAVLARDVSCVELTTTALTAAATMSGLGAFLHLDPEFALARAAQTDATLDLLGRSEDRGLTELSATHPLLGLPTAFKDLVPVAGLPLTMGTAALPPQVPARDHPLARRVHRAGAISVGKTQVPEFGLPCYSENRIGAPARNPLSLTRTAGGSTGGGAAAVAAGILPFAPGSDGGGSIRIPAAACGLVGLKPGRGRMSDDDAGTGVRSLMTSGPLATTAEDAALLFDVMAGHRFTVSSDAVAGSRSRGSRRKEFPLAEGPAMRTVRRALSEGLPPLRVGVTTESPFSPDVEITLEEPALAALEAGIAAVSESGHVVQGTDHCTGADRFWPEGYHRRFQTLWTSRLAESEFTEEQVTQLEPLTRYFLDLAGSRPQEKTQEAITSLQEFSDNVEEIFGPWDVIMTPMLAFRPPEIGWFAALPPEENYVQQCRFTPYSSVVNVLGLPAINVPVHTDAESMSWSVQLIGKHGSEEQLLALAATMMSAQ
ncbi:amidase [Nesterenkonia flava]|uniref:Amidase n=1 Tax=Nesterenkonia flava TaxID=469799 RepID=A0ABU1FY44_9MICC|nr:amidase [Nesterenkonia flava]MDR5713111.1 amidase [Nesterenkonia flava]